MTRTDLRSDPVLSGVPSEEGTHTGESSCLLVLLFCTFMRLKRIYKVSQLYCFFFKCGFYFGVRVLFLLYNGGGGTGLEVGH